MDVWAIVVSSIVALLVGWLGAWATLRSGNPKRKVGWWEQSNTPLFAESRYAGQSGPLTVQLGNTRLRQPRIIDLAIANLGNHDITAVMFHEGAPLRFSFGTPVLAILEYTSEPAANLSQVIDTYADNGALPTGPSVGGVELKPTLLRSGQTVIITVLVDGGREVTRCTDFPLVDVDEAMGLPALPARPFREVFRDTLLHAIAFRNRP
ncbi:hypothetical protein ACFVUW_07260 [Streptomyces xiamenensis]|uniref:hypothetical protein n=1 Tax=Streptomyces xiamenensis TaxID=408015 RepID=UPI0036ED620D